jgi:signal transduction histidine kinase
MRHKAVKVQTGAKTVAIDNGLSLSGQQRGGILSDLPEAEKLAAIGRRVLSLSHDIKRSLSSIIANIESLERHKLRANDRNGLLMEVQHDVFGITHLIDSFLHMQVQGKPICVSERKS